MDEELIEKITRLVLSRLEEESNRSVLNGWNEQSFEVNERVEYPPLTNEEIRQWKNITSSLRFSHNAEVIPADFVPLSLEEMKTWRNLSVSISSKEQGHSRVKFFQHYE